MGGSVTSRPSRATADAEKAPLQLFSRYWMFSLATLAIAIGALLSSGREGRSAYNAVAADYDTHREKAPGWPKAREAMLNGRSSLADENVLDLGCGTGAFFELILALGPKSLDAIDVSSKMIAKAQERSFKLRELGARGLRVWLGDVEELPAAAYDVVFSGQILQNLDTAPNAPNVKTPMEARVAHLRQIHRVLRVGGRLVATTRYVPPGGDYSSMYWYADPAIVPESLSIMRKKVPAEPCAEIASSGFASCSETNAANSLMYRATSYRGGSLDQTVRSPAWRAADSFFLRVSAAGELDGLVAHLEKREKNGTLEHYITERDALRMGAGHVVVVVGHTQ